MNGAVRWGVLGAARIALKKVLPGMKQSAHSRVVAIASRDPARAQAAAHEHDIRAAYGSYEALLADADVDVVYNPLPNDLHVPWSIRALEAGKHVLCEKPIALTAREARTLQDAAARAGRLVGEAFMVRTHPQWLEVKRRVDAGEIGPLRLVNAHFSYFLDDPANIRNRVDAGGGALMDVGCYPVHLSRWLFGAEPTRVLAAIDRDPRFGVDRLTSALLEFPAGHAIFSCATQLVPWQHFQLFGTRGRVAVEIPFNAPADRACRILQDDGSELAAASAVITELPVVDQYAAQADAFSRAVRGEAPVPVDLADAIGNMAVIDALFRSAESGGWEAPASS